MYIGKLLKSWGRLLSILDPEDPQRQQQQLPRKDGQPPPKRKRKRAAGRGRGRMFAGSEEPLLLLARKKRQLATKTKNGRRPLDVSSLAATATVAPLPPLPPSSSPVRGGETDADCGADGGVWPGEYAAYAAVPLAGVVVSPGTMRKHKAMFGERAGLRMTPEEVERAIGAAFAVGEQLS